MFVGVWVSEWVRVVCVFVNEFVIEWLYEDVSMCLCVYGFL